MRFSIFSKVIILFLITLFSFGAFAYYFVYSQMNHESHQNEMRHYQFVTTINEILNNYSDYGTVEDYLYKIGFRETTIDNLEKILAKRRSQILRHREIGHAEVFKFSDKVFILLKKNEHFVLYKDLHSISYRNYFFAITAGLLLILLLFLFVLQSLLPLRELRMQVHRFAKGDKEVICKSDQKDEIGDLANEFDNCIQKINAMNESRVLFLRSIMHELRTPIAKGKILTAMLEEELFQKRFTSIFDRLNMLIEQFARIEQLASKNYTSNKEKFLMSDLMDRVEKMLLIDETKESPIHLSSSHYIIEADFDLFSIVLKNMIDNAIKYSDDKQVCIDFIGNDLVVSNYGEPLKEDFEKYLQPYFKAANPSEAHGFGLGMYIIKNALEAMGLELSYHYSKGKNCFSIHDCVFNNFCDLEDNEEAVTPPPPEKIKKIEEVNFGTKS
ncbi:acid-sensing histidine kinase ArsS [Helicobacter cetorum]|uniref:histidine kinase n=1 Tax=Helicobacter cetorum (strain ATCC BAA-540 / CCUG 52418 / MIT 99-5656) TaxID=1163745 RepID=I0ERR8_HELCM|nr:acid-sensing histidine kinase ArsS [Helicobacter cetorum]AFI05637.1 putative histidine kinase sensor protein [Helicobacter cetorum MIT 99-5656]